MISTAAKNRRIAMKATKRRNSLESTTGKDVLVGLKVIQVVVVLVPLLLSRPRKFFGGNRQPALKKSFTT